MDTQWYGPCIKTSAIRPFPPSDTMCGNPAAMCGHRVFLSNHMLKDTSFL